MKLATSDSFQVFSLSFNCLLPSAYCLPLFQSAATASRDSEGL